MHDLEAIRLLAERESGLAVAITRRPDGSPRASVVNAGVIAHPKTADPVVAFISLGSARKLADLRRHPSATIVFRSGWQWVAVEGHAELVGPQDRVRWPADTERLALIRTVYAAAAGGEPDDWMSPDASFHAEGHTAVLLTPTRVYPT